MMFDEVGYFEPPGADGAVIEAALCLISRTKKAFAGGTQDRHAPRTAPRLVRTKTHPAKQSRPFVDFTNS